MFTNLFSQPKSSTIVIVTKDLRLFPNFVDLAVRCSKKYEQIVFAEANVSTLLILEQDLNLLQTELHRRGLALRQYEQNSVMTYELVENV